MFQIKWASSLYRNIIPSGVMSKHNFSLKLTWHDCCHVWQQKHKSLWHEFARSYSNINDQRRAKTFVRFLSFHIQCKVMTPPQKITSDLHMVVQLLFRAGRSGCSRLLSHCITPVCRNTFFKAREGNSNWEFKCFWKSPKQPVQRDNDSAASNGIQLSSVYFPVLF